MDFGCWHTACLVFGQGTHAQVLLFKVHSDAHNVFVLSSLGL
jgi:hypothetical protein